MQQLDSDTLKYLERIIANRKEYDRRIRMRKAILMIKETDENIGGSRGSFISQAVATEAIKYATDPYIQTQERYKNAVENLIKHASETWRNIIEYRYDCPERYTWEEVGDLIGYSKSRIYVIRYDILETLARMIGILGDE